jgi:alkylation response protein AidB-like acyl-CoA dehydrogenase
VKFAFTEEQEELRQTARSFLADRSGSEDIRRAMEGPTGWDADLWKQIGSELGWTAVHVPEEFGGIGMGYVELIALIEVMGEALVCAPFFSSVCLGANAILCAGTDAQKRDLLPGIAEGNTRATLASDANDTSARRDGDGWVLTGSVRHVPDGHTADLVVLAARTDAATALFAIPGDAPGFERSGLPTLDRTRRLAQLDLRDVRLPDSARLGEGHDAGPALRKTLDLACVALAAEQVGGAQRCLDMAVDYGKQREQFGRAIGSFQAIKHKCADMMVAVEAARSAAYWAGCAAAQDSEELPEVASLAKANASEAFYQCAAQAIQVLGGVGFTWEYDAHLYFKRARAGEALLGTPAFHRERIAKHLGL